jgi:hypothetical protein
MVFCPNESSFQLNSIEGRDLQPARCESLNHCGASARGYKRSHLTMDSSIKSQFYYKLSIVFRDRGSITQHGILHVQAHAACHLQGVNRNGRDVTSHIKYSRVWSNRYPSHIHLHARTARWFRFHLMLLGL